MKIKLPEYEPIENIYKDGTIESKPYLNNHFNVIISTEPNYVYGCITPTKYYDDSIVVSDDIKFKNNSIENLEKIYNKIKKQLNERYTKWILSFFEEK